MILSNSNSNSNSKILFCNVYFTETWFSVFVSSKNKATLIYFFRSKSQRNFLSAIGDGPCIWGYFGSLSTFLLLLFSLFSSFQVALIDMTFLVDWALSNNYLSIYLSSSSFFFIFPLPSRPDMTFLVDWALRTNYLSFPSIISFVLGKRLGLFWK